MAFVSTDIPYLARLTAQDRVERQLKLPPTNLENVSVRSVTPDAVDLIGFPDHPAYRDSLKARESLSCFYQLEPPERLFVIHCVSDYNRSSAAQSKALVGMVAGLYQRRLLGMTNQFVFGLIRRSVHFLQVVAASWHQGKVSPSSRSYDSFFKNTCRFRYTR